MEKTLFVANSKVKNESKMKVYEDIGKNKLKFTVGENHIILDIDQIEDLSLKTTEWVSNQHIGFNYPKKLYKAPIFEPIAYRSIHAKKKNGKYKYKFLIKHLNGKVYDIPSCKRIYTFYDKIFDTTICDTELVKQLYSSKYIRKGNNNSKPLVNDNKKNLQSLYCILVLDESNGQLKAEIGFKTNESDSYNDWMFYCEDDLRRWITPHTKYENYKVYSWTYLKIPKIKVDIN